MNRHPWSSAAVQWDAAAFTIEGMQHRSNATRFPTQISVRIDDDLLERIERVASDFPELEGRPARAIRHLLRLGLRSVDASGSGTEAP